MTDPPPELLELMDAWEELGVWPAPSSGLEALARLRDPLDVRADPRRPADPAAAAAILRER